MAEFRSVCNGVVWSDGHDDVTAWQLERLGPAGWQSVLEVNVFDGRTYSGGIGNLYRHKTQPGLIVQIISPFSSTREFYASQDDGQSWWGLSSTPTDLETDYTTE